MTILIDEHRYLLLFYEICQEVLGACLDYAKERTICEGLSRFARVTRLGFPAGRPQVRDVEWQDFNILLISALKSGASVIELRSLQMVNSSMIDSVSYNDARQWYI